jgi:sulfoxide reductase heme-binding subunit YedZ
MSAARFAKVLIFANALVPLVMMIVDAATGSLGANPIEFVTRTTGTMTMLFLVLTLAVTPARVIFKLPWLNKVRRTVGLFSFFWLCLHLLTYLWLDQFFDLGAILGDAIGRPFIAVGLIAFGMMVPLAWTSTNAAVKRMGGEKWRKLHRMTYTVACLGVVHYWLLVKADLTGPITYGAAVALLLGWRLIVFLRQPARLPRPAREPKESP